MMEVQKNIISLEDPSEEEIEATIGMLNDWQEDIISQQQRLMYELSIPFEFACAILYLRTRSYWSQQLEEKLIQMGRNGEKLPEGFYGGDWKI
jgi:hypothetical protein